MTIRLTTILLAAACFLAAADPRQVQLEGAQNFRDIGGYPAAGGKKIKRGLVYRSDSLYKLTDADYEKLSTLGIATVCDFRSSYEREREVTVWKAKPTPEMMNPAMGGGAAPGQDPTKTFIGPLLAAETPEQANALADTMMRTGMIKMINEEAGQIGKMLRRLTDTDKPMLYHCTAGKDRTGVSTAFLMKILGVPEESIYEDYLLVNKLVPPSKNAAETAKRLEAMAGRPVDPKPFEALMGTRREWLAAGFAAIPDFDAYRREKLGISDADVAKLRARLLE